MKKFSVLLLIAFLIAGSVNLIAQNLSLPAEAAGSAAPTIIKLGTFSEDFYYNDAGNTGRGSDGYRGTALKDVFYEFTITEYMDITVQNAGLPLSCATAPTTGSYQSNTYLIQANPYQLIASHSSANTAMSLCRGRKLPPGTYYAIYETALENPIGNITAIITGTKVAPPQEPTIIDIGKMNMEKVYMNTQNTALLTNAYQGLSTNDVWYRFTVEKPFEVIISHCGSSLTGTRMYLLDETQKQITFLSVNNNNCDTSNELRCVLAAGTYYVVSEGLSSNGNITTHISGTGSNSYYRNFGTNSGNFSHSHEVNASTAINCYDGNFKKGVVYKFALSTSMKVTASHEGSSAQNTSISLLDSSFKLLKNHICKDNNKILEAGEIPAGEYYIISEGKEGIINTLVTGSVPAQRFIVSAGIYSADFHHTHTQNTLSTSNAYTGRSTNDVFYKLDIRVPMNLVISHCGSEVSDTYVYLLNSTYNLLYSNDDYTGAEGCTNTRHSYLKVENLAAGVYYVVSEGYSANGNITTTIEGFTRNQSQSGKTPPGSENYIREFTPLKETINATSLTLDKCMQTIHYFDGLARETQTIQVGITPRGENLLLLQEYDEFARPHKAWLPTPLNTTDVTPVAAKELATRAETYYGDKKAYTLNYYEDIADPLDRVIRTTLPGEAWKSSVENGYQTNTESGVFAVDYYYINKDGVLEQKGKYAKNELYVESVRDEDGKIQYVFTDKLGRVVLERQMNDSEQINTYYVYDQKGNRAYVLPPMIDGDISSDNLSRYAYSYKYDGKGRCTSVQLPGLQPTTMVYDKSDRLVFSQDRNQLFMDPVNRFYEYKWTAYKYDSFGRLICKYEINAYRNNIIPDIYAKDKIITETFSTQKQATSLGDTGYSNDYVPFTGASNQLIFINYYDDYAFLDLLPASVKSQLQYTAKTGYGVNHNNAQGRLTGKRVYDLNEKDKYTVHVYYYDVHGNIIQYHATNHLDGYEKNYYKRTFTGNVEVHYQEHSVPGQETIKQTYLYAYDHANRPTRVSHRFGDQASVTLSSIRYNELGLPEYESKHSDNHTSKYTYNIRNQLTETHGNLFSEKLTYLPYYNGNLASYEWLTGDQGYWRKYDYTYDGLNRLKKAEYMEYGSITASANKGNYNLEINEYDKNGNIRQLTRYGLHTAHRLSAYTSEPVNFTSKVGVIDKLTLTYLGNTIRAVKDSAPYDPVFNGAMHFVDGADETVEYEYDGNGNLRKDLNRRISNVYYNILNLPMYVDFDINKGYRTYYHYDGEGKKIRVRYLSANANEALSIPPVASIAFLNRDSENVVFETLQDHFISESDSSLVDPTNGLITVPSYPLRILDYCGNVLYKDGKLDRILTPQGYIEKNESGKFVYHYYLRDYLGNNRMVIDENLTIKQVNHYYPFGALFGEQFDIAGQNYKFGGKELDRIHGLDWIDFEARMKDGVLGRFISRDPHAERYYSISPYVFGANNPVRFGDPDGRDFWDFILGYAQAVASNMTGISTNVDTSVLSNANHYNAGRIVGDIFSIIGGIQESIAGMGMVVGGAGAEVTSAGTATAVAVPAVVEGAVIATHGALTVTNAVKSLSSGDGRVMEANGNKSGSGAAPKADSSRAARREAMRQEGIPTSQQPKSQSKNASGREYSYEVPKNGGGKKIKSVQQQTMDRSHKNQPHWEAGDVKIREGKIQKNNYDRPKLEENKSKVNY